MSRLQPATPAAPPAPSLGQRTARGVAWLLLQTFGIKIIGVAGQIVLAWLLTPADFGLVSLAFAVTAFTSLLQHTGLREMLIQRQARFKLWSNPAAWIALGAGTLNALIIASLAPLMARLYGEERLVGLLLVLAAVMPPLALGQVPSARLQGQLRFGAIARVEVALAALSMGLSVLLAWNGLGPYAFVLPMLVAACARTTVYWLLTRPPLRLDPQWRRWRFLLPASGLMLAANLCSIVTQHGDYMILGWLHDKEVLGVYFFAFGLSLQVMTLVISNMTAVLLPALSQLRDDPRRQLDATLRATRIIGLVGVPVCLLQAAAADPVIRILFEPKWYGAIPLLQVLSIGMALRVIGMGANSLLLAQGRYGRNLALMAFHAAAFVALVTAGTVRWGAMGTAMGVLAYFALSGPVNLYVSVRPSGGRWRDLAGHVLPLGPGAAAVAAAWGAGRLVPAEWPGGYWLRLAVIALVGAAVYLPLARWLAPASWRELMERARALRRGTAG